MRENILRITDASENLSSLWRNNVRELGHAERPLAILEKYIYPCILYLSTTHFLRDIIDFGVIVDNLVKWDAPERDVSLKDLTLFMSCLIVISVASVFSKNNCNMWAKKSRLV